MNEPDKSEPCGGFAADATGRASPISPERFGLPMPPDAPIVPGRMLTPEELAGERARLTAAGCPHIWGVREVPPGVSLEDAIAICIEESKDVPPHPHAAETPHQTDLS